MLTAEEARQLASETEKERMLRWKKKEVEREIENAVLLGETSLRIKTEVWYPKVGTISVREELREWLKGYGYKCRVKEPGIMEAKWARDEYAVQGNYGYGWDDLAYHDTRKGAMEELACYKINEPTACHRIVKRREKI